MSGYPRPRTVAPYPLAGLARAVGVPAPPEHVTLTGVTHASGSVRPGDLYAALPGARRHGAEFV
ncbi:MAG: UDP-N-acetylmuramoyl-L-alanyl-D-glutamate--2,6-diaminopimelate ligase, partial [Micromonosporaceae bacterium]